jgi:hypothetical protein
MDRIVGWIEGSCHCKRVQFRVRLVDGFNTARRCTCSYCRMRGAIAVSTKLDDIDIVAGADVLSVYEFNTMTAKHHFCSSCGIYTHHQRRSNPREYGVNVACLAGISPFDFDEVPVIDGVQHPSDGERRTGPKMAGVLKFVRATD